LIEWEKRKGLNLQRLPGSETTLLGTKASLSSKKKAPKGWGGDALPKSRFTLRWHVFAGQIFPLESPRKGSSISEMPRGKKERQPPAIVNYPGKKRQRG